MVYRNDLLRDNYKEQDKFIKQIAEHIDDPRQTVVVFSDAAAADGVMNWSPGRKTRIIGARLVNGDVSIDATTNMTVLDIDVEDGSGAKTHDFYAKAETVAVGADAIVEITLPASPAFIVEATELMKIARTITGTQGELSIVFDYQFIE